MKFFRASSAATFLLAASLGFGQVVTAYSDLHDFGGTVTNANGNSGPDGFFPNGEVVFDSAGNMFGTTENGGANGGTNGDGMVWEITSSGTYKDLHDFGGTVTNANGAKGRDGVNPAGGVTFDSAGNMYGTAIYGGANAGPYGAGAGMVWEITKSGAYKDLHDFGATVVNAGGTNGPDGAAPEVKVVFDSAGNMYGTTLWGGPNAGYGNTNGSGTVWEITKAGTYKDLHDFGGTELNLRGTSYIEEGASPSGVTVDSSGNLFGTADSGANYNHGMVWEITNSGIYKHLHDFGATSPVQDGFNSPGVTIDSLGNLFGTTSAGGTSQGGMVWEITQSGAYKDLHDFGGTIINTAGKRVSDDEFPYGGVTIDSEGNLYGTTGYGGPEPGVGFGGGNVWEIANTGAYRNLHDFGATSPVKDGLYPEYKLTFDSAGNLVGTTPHGGANIGTYDGDGIVWKLGLANVHLQSFTLTPNAVIGGGTSTGRLVLDQPAPVGGLLVTLSSNSSWAKPPVTVMVPQGSGSAHFTMTTSAVAVAVSTTITATLGSSSLTASLAVHPAYPVGLSVSPASVVGGMKATGTVTLNGPAPAGGWGIHLTCSSSGVSVPTYVIVAAGSSTATFPITTSAVVSAAHATITASLNSFSQSAQLTVTP